MTQIIGAGGGGGGGGKGGGGAQGAYTPKTQPDTLDSIQYAEILDLIGEGEIEGFPSTQGYTRGTAAYDAAMLKDIYFDNTPILNPQANPAAPQTSDYNFQNLELYPRYGTQGQDYIPLAYTVQNETAVGVKVQQGTPVTRTISDVTVNAVRVTITIPALQIITDKGDVEGNTIGLEIWVSYNSGAYTKVVTDVIAGRTADAYQREYRINFTQAGPYSIRVYRAAADFNDPKIQGDLFWTSYTEIIYARLRYPNSALMGIRIDAHQFNNIPQRTYKVRGLKVRIPNNGTVNQTTGAISYAGVWGGTFAAAQWTSDPAWCLWDLLTSTRYGTGNYLDTTKLDKWSFYAASVYASESVPNGLGGTEPRFSCNVNIQTQDEAYKVINQLASVFRAMPYWSAGAVTISQDRPTDASYLFTSSNVTEEGFTYSGSSLKTRHTVAVVKYFDMDSRDTGFEVVEDQEAIRKYGVIKTEIDAFACTSRGQARRLGEWLLYSEQYETETLTFKAGMDAGAVVRPGQIIEVADPVRAGERCGGRIVSATAGQVIVDSVSNIRFAGLNKTLSVVLPNGTVETKTISSYSGTTFNLASSFSQAPSPGSVWIYQDASVETQQFRVISVEEQDDSTYAISALSYNASKYNYIERDVPLTTRDVTNLNEPPPAPQSLRAEELLYENNGQVLSKIIVGWAASNLAASYKVRYRLGAGNWVTDTTVSPDYEIINSAVGEYTIEVASANAGGKSSAYTPLVFNAIGKTAPPATIPDLFIAPVDSKSAELYWPQSEDIDVRIGGQIRIRHTSITDGTASWGKSNDIVPAVAGSSTRKIVPLLEGTYYIRAVDSLGNESAGTASVVVDLPEPQDTFLVQEYREDDNSPPFNGTATDMYYSTDESGLILTSSGLIDDMATDGNWDGLSFIDYIGGAVAEGSYVFSETLDLGATYDVDIQTILKTRAFESNNLWDDRGAEIDLWDSIDGDDLGSANCALYVRTTPDNPSGTPTWGTWQPFVNNTTRGRGLQFKLVATSADPAQNVIVEQLGVITKLQRRTEQQRNISSGASAYAVTFPTAFYGSPSVGITAQDMATGDYFTISSVSRTGFTVTFRNSGGSMVSKTFDYQAVGHGRQIA